MEISTQTDNLPRATHANGDLIKAIKESWWTGLSFPVTSKSGKICYALHCDVGL